MSKLSRPSQLRAVQNESFLLFKKKNQDYGDAFADFGPVGVLVRLGDKLRRFTSITQSGVALVDDESLRDTLIDLHNYAAMAVILMDETAVDAEDLGPESTDFEDAFDDLLDTLSCETSSPVDDRDMLSKTCDAFDQMIQNGED